MELVPSYLLPPGCCTFCRGTAEPVIDTGLTTEDLEAAFFIPPEDRGAVYLCGNCGNDIAQLLGAMPADAVKRLLAELEETRTLLASAVTERDNFAELARAAVAALPEAEPATEEEPVHA